MSATNTTPPPAQADAARLVTRVMTETFRACEIAEGFETSASDWEVDFSAIRVRVADQQATLEANARLGAALLPHLPTIKAVLNGNDPHSYNERQAILAALAPLIEQAKDGV